MTTDFSRVRSDPLLDFAGVELKQGGVVLDADINEDVAIVDRRLRAATSDILGRARVSSTTPDAFLINAIATGLTIGRGRLYVDGLLAENHGAASDDPSERGFDPLLSEPVFTEDIDYAVQPYLPLPPALPEAGRHLVYLDVWQRPVTHLEQPALMESAVGVETSSRLQTVWQVRTAKVGSNTTCATPDAELDDWAELIAPSSGRLSTDTFEPPPAEDPCELPPSGGYRGLENQLYRVQIHDPGQPDGGATFKWSRDNASVGSRVASIVSTTELELDSIGRDEVLRFNVGDWVEICDDTREFSQQPGEMRRLTGVDDATRRITFTGAMPSAMLPSPPTLPDSEQPRIANLRVRRWDQKGAVYRTDPGGPPVQIQDLDATSDGLIEVPASGVHVILENGVTVSFDSVGDKGLRAGDWWVFAARTTDATVEKLQQAPPRGIHHHYARLGVWDIASGNVSDCREPWPPPVVASGGDNCACTVCVTPEQHASGELTVQAAIGLVRERGGGTVCLEVGNYRLDAPLDLSGAKSLRLVGKGLTSQLVATTRAIQIDEARDVRLESFVVLCRPVINDTDDAAVSLANSQEVVLHRLWIGVINDNPVWAAVALRGALIDIRVCHCMLSGAFGLRSGDADGGETGLTDLRVDDNVFDCRSSGVQLAGVTVHQLVNRLRGNRITGCLQAGVELLGATTPGHGIEVSGNSFAVDGDGIVANVDGLSVRGNEILQADTADPGQQVGLRLLPGLQESLGNCRVLGNHLAGFAFAGIEARATLLSDTMIKQNRIERVGNGLVLEGNELVDRLSIENNQLAEIAEVAIRISAKTAQLAILGNQLEVQGPAPAVHAVAEAGDCVFSHNQCRRIEAGDAADVTLAANTLVVASNRVQGSELSLDLVVGRDHFTALGNITQGAIHVDGVDLQPPWKPLNVQGV